MGFCCKSSTTKWFFQTLWRLLMHRKCNCCASSPAHRVCRLAVRFFILLFSVVFYSICLGPLHLQPESSFYISINCMLYLIRFSPLPASASGWPLNAFWSRGGFAAGERPGGLSSRVQLAAWSCWEFASCDGCRKIESFQVCFTPKTV